MTLPLSSITLKQLILSASLGTMKSSVEMYGRSPRCTQRCAAVAHACAEAVKVRDGGALTVEVRRTRVAPDTEVAVIAVAESLPALEACPMVAGR